MDQWDLAMAFDPALYVIHKIMKNVGKNQKIIYLAIVTYLYSLRYLILVIFCLKINQ